MIPSCFYEKEGGLFCEDVSLQTICEEVGTPLYVYSYQKLSEQYQSFANALAKHDLEAQICFSVKANPNAAILKSFFNLGAGADVVSGGELQRALNAGCDSKKIVFSGVGKTQTEMKLALEGDILQFNVESEEELELLNDVAGELGKKASIAMRVNPDVDAKTHPYISTGLHENKFGIDHNQVLEIYKKASVMPHIEISGIDCHIGSQITSIAPFRDAFLKIKELVVQLEEADISIDNIDLGGGVGIPYEDEREISIEDYAKVIAETFSEKKWRFLFEPGRFLVAQSGAFITSVLFNKTNSAGKHFTIVDGAFNDFLRPVLYQAYHHVAPIQKTNSQEVTTDIVGPICESTDTFVKNYKMTEVKEGQALAMFNAGAYGASMAGYYNSRSRPKEVLVRGNEFFVIKEADALEDITKGEKTPEFLS